MLIESFKGFTTRVSSVGWLAWVVSLLALGWNLIYSLGNKPVIMADEYIYARQALLLPIEQSQFGNFFYSWVFSSTSICGSNFYQCNQVLNSLMLWGVAVAVLLAVPGKSPIFKSLSSAGVQLLPSAVFVSFFMPEILLTLLLAAAAVLLSSNKTPYSVSSVFSLGGILGVSTLVKPHALLLGGVILVCVSIGIFLSKQVVGQKLSRIIVLFTGFGLGKFALGVILAGRPGMSLLSIYEGTANAVIWSLAGQTRRSVTGAEVSWLESWLSPRIAEMIGTSPNYLIAFMALFAVPLTLLFLTSAPASTESRRPRLAFWALSLSAFLMLSAALFSAAHATLSGDSHTNRILFRYVEILILPTIAVILIRSESLASLKRLERRSVGVSMVFSGLAIAGLIFLDLNLQMPDGPWLYTIIRFGWLLALVLIAGGAWILFGDGKRKVDVPRASVFMAGFVIFSTIGTQFWVMEATRRATPSDAIAEFISAHISPSQGSTTLLVSPDKYWTTHSLLISGRLEIDFRRVPAGASLDWNRIRVDYDQVLVVGDVNVPSQLPVVADSGELRLVRANRD